MTVVVDVRDLLAGKAEMPDGWTGIVRGIETRFTDCRAFVESPTFRWEIRMGAYPAPFPVEVTMEPGVQCTDPQWCEACQ